MIGVPTEQKTILLSGTKYAAIVGIILSPALGAFLAGLMQANF
jgi:hypothetical protein